jgi:asparagine synthetase B (glutamine-hydrolysing)
MPFSDEPPVTVVPTEVVQIESAVSAPVVEVPVSTVTVSVVPSGDSSAIAAARKNYSPFKTTKQQQQG